MPKPLFISHSFDDKDAAQKVCDFLEGEGIDCWIAPRDISAGKPFDDAIVEAINATQAMLVVFTSRANEAEYVKSEVNLAFSKGKTIFVLRLEDITPKGGLELILSRPNWTDGFPPPLESRLRDLAASARALLGIKESKPPNVVASEGTPSVPIVSVAPFGVASGSGTSAGLAKAESQPSDTGQASTRQDGEGREPPVSEHLERGAKHDTDAMSLDASALEKVNASLKELTLKRAGRYGEWWYFENGEDGKVYRSLCGACRGAEVPVLCRLIQEAGVTQLEECYKAMALLRRAGSGPAARRVGCEVIRTVGKHCLHDSEPIAEMACNVVDEWRLPAQEKWAVLSKSLADARGRLRDRFVRILCSMTPDHGRTATCRILLQLLASDPTHSSSSLIASRLRMWECKCLLPEIRDMLHALRAEAASNLSTLLADWGDFTATPVIRAAIERFRDEWTNGSSVGRLLASLYRLEGPACDAYCGEIIQFALPGALRWLLPEIKTIRGAVVVEVVREIAATTSDEAVKCAATDYLSATSP